jgi:hypothetical protein
MKLSMRGYATHRGVAVSAVSRAVREGRIALGRDKKIDVAKADKQWEANTTKRGGSDSSVTAHGLPTYAESRAAREAYAALREKQEYEARASSLLPRDQVLSMIRALIGAARAKLLEIPSSLAPVLAIESTERRCQEILQASIYEALNELSDKRNYRVGDIDLGATA